MIEVFMPKAGMDMKEGMLVRWLKEVGDPVEKDEPIMQIETDKITMEAEAPASGFLLKTYCENGDMVPVLGIMGYIGALGEKAPDQPQAPLKGAPEGKTAAEAIPPDTAGVRATPYARQLAKRLGLDLSTVSPGGKHKEILGADVLHAEPAPAITPLAKKIAQVEGVDLSAVQGTGPHGKICKPDVLRAMEPPLTQGAGALLSVERRTPLNNMNRIILERMTRSHTEVPSVTQSVLVDLTELLALRAKINARCALKLTINDFVLKAAAIAVKEIPKARTFLEGNEYITYGQANIGFAVSVGDGLLVPVVYNADQLSLATLSAKTKDLALRARGGQLKPMECTGGVFTVSNMGMYDIWDFTPIINQPEAAILGLGAARDMPQLMPDGSLTTKKICKMCLTYDHRVMNGVDAAKIKLRIRALLEHPEEMLVV